MRFRIGETAKQTAERQMDVRDERRRLETKEKRQEAVQVLQNLYADIRQQTESQILRSFAERGHPLRKVMWSKGLPEAWENGSTDLDFDVPVQTETGSKGMTKLTFVEGSVSLKLFVEGRELVDEGARDRLAEIEDELAELERRKQAWETLSADIGPDVIAAYAAAGHNVESMTLQPPGAEIDPDPGTQFTVNVRTATGDEGQANCVIREDQGVEIKAALRGQEL